MTLTMWPIPWVSWVTTGLVAVVIRALAAVTGPMGGGVEAMAFLPDGRAQFWPRLPTPAVAPAAYEILRRVRRSRGSARGQAVRGATDGLHSLMHTFRKVPEFTLPDSLC